MPEGDNPPRFENTLAKYRDRSVDQLKIMRETAKEMFDNATEFVIGVNGSLARREFTSGSDVDLFFLVVGEDSASTARAQNAYRDELSRRGIKMPAQGGVFEQPLPVTEMLGTIGGNDDTNIHTTRRMLFLLEGDWVFNETEFEETRCSLIKRYVEDGLEEKKICLFLLNDIIRYWRTICVDYEFKTTDGTKAKAIRLIKLRFSRMLLYFAGILAIGETQNKNFEQKRAALSELLSMPPIERMRSVLGEKADTVLSIYAEFLVALDNSEIREQLEIVGDEGVETTAYKKLAGKARTFKDQLVQLIMTELGTGHPVVKALLL